MTSRRPFLEDIIDGVFFPVIGFFLGIVGGYVLQLAEVAGWIIALLVAFAVAFFFVLLTVVDTAVDRIFDRAFSWVGLGAGIKPAQNPRAIAPRHWLVRTGGPLGFALGVLTVLYLPAELLSWL